MNYKYTTENRAGEVAKGIVQANSELEARQKLLEMRLSIITLQETEEHPVDDKIDGLFAFEFQGDKKTDNEDTKQIKGVIDAKTQELAEHRLRNEFRLENIIILSSSPVSSKTTPENITEKTHNEDQVKNYIQGKPVHSNPQTDTSNLSSEALANKDQKSNIMTELASFLHWLLFFDLLYYFFALTSKSIPIGIPVASIQEVIEGKVFVYSITALFVFFVINKFIKQHKENNNHIHTYSFYFLTIIGTAKIYFLFVGQDAFLIPSILNFPLGALIILFLLINKSNSTIHDRITACN